MKPRLGFLLKSVLGLLELLKLGASQKHEQAIDSLLGVLAAQTRLLTRTQVNSKTLTPEPSTLNPEPCTLNPEPCALHPEP